MPVKKFILIILLTVVSATGYSQLWKIRRLEVTAGTGTSHFFGDLGGYAPPENYLGFRDLSVYNTGFVLNASARYRLTEEVALRTSISGGLFRSSDRRGTNMGRAYESSSPFFEPSLIAEFYFIKNKVENNYLFLRGYRTTRYSPIAFYDSYIFAGVGGLGWNVNPNLELAYKIIRGKGFNYVVPAGIGVSRIFRGNLKAGLELGGRYVLSDLPDGYGGLGSNRDIYYFMTINATWKINLKINGFRF